MNPRSPELKTPIAATGKGTIPAAETITGTITTVGTKITGTGTLFNTELKSGDFIYANDEVREVEKVTSDTEASLVEAFGSDVTDVALDRCRALYRSVAFANTGAAEGSLQGGPFPSGLSLPINGEYGYPVKPIAYDGTGTTINIYFTK